MMLQVLTDTLRHRGIEGWLVGGTVRDRELGRLSPDLDVVVVGDPADIAREVAARLKSPWFALSARHGAYRVVGPEGHVDLARMRGDAIADDLAHRDFTMNAMAIPVAGGCLVDPFNGRMHLRDGLLVGVSDSIFRDDPLRLMRAARFCHLLGLRLDAHLRRQLQSQSGYLVRSAPERVISEIALTLDAGDSAAAVRLWEDLGLLQTLLPQVSSVEAVAVLEELDRMLIHLECLAPDAADVMARRMRQPLDGVFSRPAALRLAALVCKVSPDRIGALGRDMKLSVPMLSLLRKVAECFSGGTCGDTALRAAVAHRRSAVLFLWQIAPWEPEVIIIAASAAAAKVSSGSVASTDTDPLAPSRSLMMLWAERALQGVPQPPLDGGVLMSELRLCPGPALGHILREVRLAWEAGETKTLDEAIAAARDAYWRLRAQTL